MTEKNPNVQMFRANDHISSCGYICKKCGNPSPMGVGYVSYKEGARDASMDILECQCGNSSLPIQNYRVAWTIDVDGRTPEEAAREAMKIQRDYQSIATMFEVTDADGKETHVDAASGEAYVA